jgi:pyruvate dehydrogenase E1 component
MRNIAPRGASELEALEQREWLESLDYVIQQGDRGRVQRLLETLRDHARVAGAGLPFTAVTPYVNSIRVEDQIPIPGSQDVERRIKSLVRWNAMAMVVRANRASDGIGGHISTYASAATLYEVAFNHFFRGKDDDGGRRENDACERREVSMRHDHGSPLDGRFTAPLRCPDSVPDLE